MAILAVVAVITLLIFINGLYVAAEFSAVSSKRPRLAQLADGGNRLAAVMLDIVENPARLDAYVAACQLGITVSSLVLGFYGQSRIMALVQPFISQFGGAAQTMFQAFGATIVLLVLTVLQVVLGELIPKNVGLQYPEKLATLTARPMIVSMQIFRPLIWIFNGSGQILLRLIGADAVAEHSHVHSPEEILMLVEESGAGGLLDTEERRLLVNTLQLRDLTARKVMIPRTRMLTASADRPCDELFALLASSPYSRLPIYQESVDNIIGVVHLKDLMRAHQYRNPAVGDEAADDGVNGNGANAGGENGDKAAGRNGWTVREIMHPVSHVPDSVEIGEIMTLMQHAHLNLVIVVDEYGGTAGMITVEDLIEEIIGEFEDEFDSENPPIAVLPDGRVYLRGDLLVEDLNEALEIFLPSENVDTIGGLMLKESGGIPEEGTIVTVDEIPFRIESVYHHGVSTVSFAPTPEQLTLIRPLADEL